LVVCFREAEREEGQREKERERILSRLHTQQRALCRAQSHNPEIMTCAKIKS